MTEGSLKEVNDDTFEKEISKGVVLVDFFAEWCGPCHMQTPILKELAHELHGKASIVKLDIDKSQKIASSYEIYSVPTMVLFKEGKELKRIVGLRDASSLKALIHTAL